MNLLLAALAVAALPAQETEWTEVRFYRVHLRNGNFIDGSLIARDPTRITLQMKVGDMSIRQEQIDRVEFIKLRSLRERPPVLAKPPPKAAAAAASSAPRIRIDLSADAVATRDGVVALVDRYRKVAPEQRYGVMQQILRAGDETAVVLASLLEDPDEEIRGYIVEILTLMKDRRAVPALVKMLATRLPDLRVQVIGILGAVGDVGAAPSLRLLLKDSEGGVRGAAVTALQLLGDPDAFDAIVSLCGDPDRGVRGRSITATLEMGRRFGLLDEAGRALVSMADRAEGELRADLVYAVAQTGGKEIGPFLVGMASDPEAAVRAQAAKALGQLPDRAAADMILHRLRLERDKKTRIQLAVASQKLKLTGAVDSVLGWLLESDAEIQSCARNTLLSLTGRDFGNDHLKWSTWWSQARPRE